MYEYNWLKKFWKHLTIICIETEWKYEKTAVSGHGPIERNWYPYTDIKRRYLDASSIGLLGLSSLVLLHERIKLLEMDTQVKG